MGTLGARIGLPLAALFLYVSASQADPTITPQSKEPAIVTDPTTSAERLMSTEPKRPFWSLTGKPEVKSSAVVIFDQDDEALLYSKDAKRVLPIASITKLMTALVVREANQPLEEVLEITLEDRDTERGTTSRLLVGTELTRGDLLHLALMASENRAAHALGRNYPGGLSVFVKAMNAKAKALGMKSARFVEPTGLSSRNVSSAADLVKLVRAASEDPLIREYSTSPGYIVPVGRQRLEFRNSNGLVTKDDWQISLQKTGYTSDAGRCLVMTAFVQERPIVMILMNSFGKYTRLADARRVRRWMEGSNGGPKLAKATKETLTTSLATSAKVAQPVN
jgi:D-alanyl-D-alanine endopeptidase (penicillin-binding protein 7)